MTKKLSLVALLTLIGFQADAAVLFPCGTGFQRWNGVWNVNRNRCTIPDTGDVNASYWNGNGQWQALNGIISGFFVNPATDCSVDISDNQSEIALVPRSQISGFNGLNSPKLNGCSMVATDIRIANDMTYENPQEDQLSGFGRGTFVHEWGHAFRLNHEEAFDIMRGGQPRPLVGGTGEHISVLPSDARGIFDLYGFANNHSNLFASAQELSGGSIISTTTAGVVTMCRGQVGTVRFTIGNMGSTPVPFFRVLVRMAQSLAYDGGGFVVADNGFRSDGFAFGTFNFPFTVPLTAPNGGYAFIIYTDVDGQASELKEQDNNTFAALRVVVNC
jgi:hypothetical protein